MNNVKKAISFRWFYAVLAPVVLYFATWGILPPYVYVLVAIVCLLSTLFMTGVMKKQSAREE